MKLRWIQNNNRMTADGLINQYTIISQDFPVRFYVEILHANKKYLIPGEFKDLKSAIKLCKLIENGR